jgi:hypothetical protein
MRLAFAFALALASALAACAPGAASPNADTSDPRATPDVSLHYSAGSRIRPRWRTTSGGRELVALHDDVLDADCRFVQTAKGLRCVPDPDSKDGLSFRDTATTFRDAACTQAVATGPEGARPRFVVAREYMTSLCPASPVRVYRVATTDIVGALYHRFVPADKCGAQVDRAAEGIAVASVGAEITSDLAIGRFRIAAQGEDEGGAGLTAVYVETDDGAILFDHWVDPALHASCSFSLAADGVTRCLPDGPRALTFADRLCDRPAVATRCAAPLFLLQPDLACGERLHVFRATPSKLGGVFSSDGSACVAVPAKAGATTYGSAGEVKVTDFVAAPRVRGTGGAAARLHPNELAVGALRARVPTAPWHDTTLDVDCAFVPAVDGVTRCLPLTQVERVDAFSDPECSTASTAVYAPAWSAAACASASPALRPDLRYSASPVYPDPATAAALLFSHWKPMPALRTRVEELGHWPVTTALYLRAGARCEPMPMAELLRLRTPVREVPPATFEPVADTP